MVAFGLDTMAAGDTPGGQLRGFSRTWGDSRGHLEERQVSPLGGVNSAE